MTEKDHPDDILKELGFVQTYPRKSEGDTRYFRGEASDRTAMIIWYSQDEGTAGIRYIDNGKRAGRHIWIGSYSILADMLVKLKTNGFFTRAIP